MAGIAFDAYTTGATSASSPITWTHTCTGANGALFVVGRDDGNITSLTYAGIALTKLATISDPNYGALSIYGLLNPATGANTVSISSGSPSSVIMDSVSYSGVFNINDANNTFSSGAGGITSTTVAVTTKINNDWMLALTVAQNAVSAGANQTQRGTNAPSFNMLVGDTNAAQTPAGSHSMTSTMPASASASMIVVAFSPKGVGILPSEI